MAEVFTQAHIWADEKTGRTSRKSVNKRGLEPGYTTRVLYTRNLFMLRVTVEQLAAHMTRTTCRLCVNDCRPLLNIELDDKKLMKLAVKITGRREG